ncbi:elongator complex protein 2 [Pelomyxa schiedti]|nr:elongator complex protein 2 [Pelomyxa schiedti]
MSQDTGINAVQLRSLFVSCAGNRRGGACSWSPCCRSLACNCSPTPSPTSPTNATAASTSGSTRRWGVLAYAARSSVGLYCQVAGGCSADDYGSGGAGYLFSLVHPATAIMGEGQRQQQGEDLGRGHKLAEITALAWANCGTVVVGTAGGSVCVVTWLRDYGTRCNSVVCDSSVLGPGGDLIVSRFGRSYSEIIGNTEFPVSAVAVTSPLCVCGEKGTLQFLAVCTASNVVQLWIERDGSYTKHQVLEAPCMCESISLCALGTHVLALGGVDARVHVYSAAISTPTVVAQFQHVTSLSGHQDWVRAVDFIVDASNSTALLASASQDKRIRIWKFTVQNGALIGALESVLYGHDDWITCVKWFSPGCLLSSSMDRTVSIWTPAMGSNLWLNHTRLFGVSAHALAGNILGFYSVGAESGGSVVAAQGYNGGLHVWLLSPELPSPMPTVTTCSAIGGHYGGVRGVTWMLDEYSGVPYVLSISIDHTVRAIAPYANPHGMSWHEIARPVVHGFALKCLCPLPDHRFALASEEKIVRILEAPQTFLQTVYQIAGINEGNQNRELILSRPWGATLPALSISNKPILSQSDVDYSQSNEPASTGIDEVEDDEEGGGDYSATVSSTPIVHSHPPLEEHLTNNTLWVECNKLYGNTDDATCMCTSQNGAFVACACTPGRVVECVVRVWAWREGGGARPVIVTTPQRGMLTCMSFSPNFTSGGASVTLLATGSTDHSLCLLSCPSWKVVNHTADIHSSPITSCVWAQSEVDGQPLLVTCSTKDHARPVALWRVFADPTTGNVKAELALCLEVASPTCISPMPPLSTNTMCSIAVGTSDGVLQLWTVKKQPQQQETVKTTTTPSATTATATATATTPEVIRVIGSKVLQLQLHTDAITTVACTANRATAKWSGFIGAPNQRCDGGILIATGSLDQSVQIHHLRL